MTLALPTSPPPRAQAIHAVSFARDLVPPGSGPAQRLAFIGDRWGASYDLPAMPYVQAMAWAARLNRGRTEVVSMRVRQPGLTVGVPGTVLVKGAGQLGSSLAVDGGVAGFGMAEGQWFTLTTGGRSYLHQLAADAAFDGSGEATLSIAPMLRVSPADNAPLEISEPFIEGFVTSDAELGVDAAHHVGLAFTITERA